MKHLVGSFVALLFCISVSAQVSHTLVARKLGTTPPLRDMVLTQPIYSTTLKEAQHERWEIQADLVGGKTAPTHTDDAAPKNGDPLRAFSMQKMNEVVVEPLHVVEGLGYSNVNPPDAVVEVGANHVVTMINSGGGVSVKIFDKQGTDVVGPFDLNTLWQQFGETGLGDPLAMYDQTYDRWILTELADGQQSFLIAVSVTSDPYGAFNAYYVGSPALPDYPKMAIWDNMVIVSTNQPSQDSIPVFILDRHALLQGEEDVEVRLALIPKLNGGFQTCAPADWNGPTPPPPGAPANILRMYDDAWNGGDDKIEIFEVSVDWNIPDVVTVNGPIGLVTAPFDVEICEGGSIFDCIMQPNGQFVSALERTIMNYPHYRNFGSHESMVLCFTVEVAPALTGTRWCELRRLPGQDWTLYQEGTYSPDNDHRFMASIGMDGWGGILMAYTVLGDTTYNSLRYTGRLASDPLGEMTIKEYQFADGLNWASTFTRWGDYGSVSVDPQDERTMWYVGEYMQSGGGALWGTKIVAVQLQKDSIDVGVSALDSPNSTQYFTNQETVRAIVKNYGLTPQSNILVGMKFGATAPNVFTTITETLAPDSSILVTFLGTYDLAAVGQYTIKTFVSLADDSNQYNDTLRSNLVQLHHREAQIIGQLSSELTACTDDATIRILMRNNGFDALNAVDILWQNNAGIIKTKHWTGNLLTGKRDTVALQLEDTQIGQNNFSVWLRHPINNPDAIPDNDTLIGQMNITETGASAYLYLRTDQSPDQITWDVKDLSGTIVASSGPYELPFKTYVEPFCLHPDSCYTFTLYKNNGQGNYFRQQGDFYILDAQNHSILVYDRTSFGSSKTMGFCAEFSCSLDFEATVTKVSQEGLSNGSILIEATQNFGETLYRLNNGDWQSSALFTGLPAGTYITAVTDQNGCIVLDTLQLLFCDIQANYAVVLPTNGQNNGTVNITASNGTPPYKYSRNGGGSFSSNPTFLGLEPKLYVFCIKDAEACRRCDSLQLGTVTQIIPATPNQITVTPNPTDGFVRIYALGFPLTEDVPVTIFNTLGQPVETGRLSRYDAGHAGIFSLQTQPAATYFVRIGKPGKEATLIEIVKI